MARYIDAEILCKENFMCDCKACDDCYKTQNQKIDCEYYSTYSLNDFCAWISETPTADVRENVKGEWKSSRPDEPMFGFYYCSLCGRKRTSPQDKFCPNCGADMRGGNNDDQ